jgi:predicted RNase H-like nuclease (RuvC/YqgF family)
VCHRNYHKRKEEKQETTSKTRQERRHSRTRTNDHKFESSNRTLKEQLEEKDRIIGNLEADIVTLRKDLQKKNMQNNSKVLDDIIDSQKPHHDKSRLGYNQTEKGSSSKTTKQETYPKSYVETIKGDRKIYKEDYRETSPPRRFIFQNH